MVSVRLRNVYHASRQHTIGVVSWWYTALGLLAFIVVVSGFTEIAEAIHEHEAAAVDEIILYSINSLASPELDAFFRVATDIGGVIGVAVLTLIAALLLLLHKKHIATGQLLCGVLGAASIVVIAKSLFARARPDLWEQIVTELSYSFPSGHAMASSALAFSVVLIMWHTRWRWWAVLTASLYVLFVGFSRLYLGVHYPTDVLGGWLLSAAWVIFVALALGILQVRRSTN